MEEALRLKDDTSRSRFTIILMGSCVLAGAALLSFFLSAKVALLAGILGLGVLALLMMSLEHALMFFYFYLFCDGAIKILTNYHPLFHVSQDLIIIAITLRSLSDRANGGYSKFFRTPFFYLVLTFLLWILVQYLNPFGLGILPSVAGTKVYLSGIMIFLLSYQHLKKGAGERLLTWLVFLGLAEGALATIEYLFFQGFVFKLHPRYVTIAGDRFVGPLFRPFGTTSAPGAPSMWIFLTANIAVYLLMNARSKFSRLLAGAHLLFAVPTLIFCQTRAALVLSLLGCVLVLLQPNGGLIRRLALVGVVLGLLASLISFSGLSFFSLVPGAEHLSEEQKTKLQDRFLSLQDKSTLKESRAGALEQSLKLAEKTTTGIGLSRVGAASAVWGSRIDSDPYFDRRWSFADNLYRAIFTEIGVFGLLAWLMMILAPTLFLLRSSLRIKGDRRLSALVWLCGTYPLMLLAGGFGSEGVLYNPSSGFMWLILAIGLKEAANEPAKA